MHYPPYPNKQVVRDGKTKHLKLWGWIHLTDNVCVRLRVCYSQIKHQIVETLLWYAVMESYCREISQNTAQMRRRDRRKMPNETKLSTPRFKHCQYLLFTFQFVLLFLRVWSLVSYRIRNSVEIKLQNKFAGHNIIYRHRYVEWIHSVSWHSCHPDNPCDQVNPLRAT